MGGPEQPKISPELDDEAFYRRNRLRYFDDARHSDALEQKDPEAMEVYERLRRICAQHIVAVSDEGGDADYYDGLGSVISHEGVQLADFSLVAGDTQTATILYRLYYTYFIVGNRTDSKFIEIAIKGRAFESAPEVRTELSELLQKQETFTSDPNLAATYFLKIFEESKPFLEELAK